MVTTPDQHGTDEGDTLVKRPSLRLGLRVLALFGMVFSLVGAALLVRPVEADDVVTIKLGTLAPEGSPWYKAMRRMGDQWDAATGGKVKLKIYPGGISGNETQILKKMRLGSLHAGMITATGFTDIDRSPLALQLPMTISSYEELDFVLGKLGPQLEQRVEAKDFKVLSWGDAGWVYFFTKTPTKSLSELKKTKLYAWSGDPPATDAFLKAGLKPVTVDSTDVLMSLQTGMIEGFPSTPLAALSMQWFGLSKQMLNVPWCPMVGATILTKKAWNQIPAALQPKIMEIARMEGEKLKAEVRKLDSDALGVMKKAGLVIHEPKDGAEWKAFADQFIPLMRGTVVPEDMADAVVAQHKAFLASKSGKK